jgi:SAM-dependent methyltransferase
MRSHQPIVDPHKLIYQRQRDFAVRDLAAAALLAFFRAPGNRTMKLARTISQYVRTGHGRMLDALNPHRISARERHKYVRMWELSDYRQNHDCAAQAGRFIELAEIAPGASVLDVGCGPGYAARVFLAHRLRVIAVDIADNAPDPEIRPDIDFVCGSIWELSHLPAADYGFCTDVMEHIPPNKITHTLSTIRRLTRRLAFFDISLRKDGFGQRIGETLHLTVRPLEWWTAQLSQHWDAVRVVATNESDQSASWIVC